GGMWPMTALAGTLQDSLKAGALICRWSRIRPHEPEVRLRSAVDQVPLDELVDRVAAVRTEEQPDVVASSGHDGITAHPAHIVVGAATDAALGRFAAGSAGG